MRRTLIFLAVAALMASCNLPAPGLAPPPTPAASTPTDTPAIPSPFPGTISPTPEDAERATPTEAPVIQDTPTSQPATTEPTATKPPAAETPTQPPDQTEPPPGDPRPEEAIMILQPGPGSRVTSPVLVAGIANPTFEQNLGVQLVLDDGTVLALGPAMIQAELGERGPFEVLVPFEISGERQGFVQVFDSSARDGGITHLSSSGVTLVESGEENIIEVEPYLERIWIESPVLSEQVSGGVARVQGFAVASFEQTLLVEVLDVDGNIVGSQSVLVQSPEMGVPGPFNAEVPYQVSAAGPGRIVVRDPSAAFEGDVHVSSVEIELAP